MMGFQRNDRIVSTLIRDNTSVRCSRKVQTELGRIARMEKDIADYMRVMKPVMRDEITK